MNQVGPQGLVTGAPRPRFLFLVRFVRGEGQGSAKWQNGLTFAVKKFDRPKVSPQVTELNQYNKKRLVQTGVKYSPVSIDFHDTVDAVVNQMWTEYASYHFGDFRRSEGHDWGYDATTANFNDSGEQGFGHTLPMITNNAPESSKLNSQFFFEKVECYQLFGGQFVQFDLVHPVITEFNPDEMDYETSSDGHSIRMTLEYEAILYKNKERPGNIKGHAFLSSLFGDGAFLNGDVYEPPGHPIGANFGASNAIGQVNQVLNTVSRLTGGKISAEKLGLTPAVSTVLGSFGNFNFDAYAKNILGPVTGPATAALGMAKSLGTKIASANKTNEQRAETNQVGVRTDINTKGDEPPSYLA